MSWLHLLENLDKIAFLFINHDADHAFFDPVMLFLRNPLSWIPLYVFILWYVFWKLKNKAWPFIILSCLTFLLTDAITSRILKPFFGRLRPCCEPSLNGIVRKLVDCGGIYSFPSNHAANHFGLAAMWFWSLLLMTGKKYYVLWIWAILIGYAQIYVGKHYPFDIIAGGIFGCAIGAMNAKIFQRWVYPHHDLKGNDLRSWQQI
jgi:membrane-associated phospholipid phosphatase